MSGGLSASDVNASIPLQAGQGVAQPNPLQQFGQVADLKNSLNTLSLFPGQQQLQQQQIQGGGLDIQDKQVTLAQHFRQAGYNGLVPLLATQGPITHAQLTAALGGLEASGISTQPIISDILNGTTNGDGPEFDAQIRAQIAANSQTDAASAVSEVTPRQGTIDVGSQIQPVNIAAPGQPNVGQVTPIGDAFQKGLTPQELAAPVQIGVVQSGPNKGAPIMGTQAQFLGMDQGSAAAGSLPPSLIGPNGAPPRAPGVVTDLSPAQKTQQQVQGTASADAFQQYAQAGVQARSQNAILGNMLGDADIFTTGGQAGMNALRNFAVRNAPQMSQAFGVDPAKVAANESFDKFANQIADAQGAGSDARLAVNQAANPSSHISPQGVQLIIRQLQGNGDYMQARAQLASQYPDQTDRAGFESSVGSKLDPRAFQFNRMTPQQRVEYAKSLSPTDLAAVRNSYNYAAQNNLFGQ